MAQAPAPKTRRTNGQTLTPPSRVPGPEVALPHAIQKPPSSSQTLTAKRPLLPPWRPHGPATSPNRLGFPEPAKKQGASRLIALCLPRFTENEKQVFQREINERCCWCRKRDSGRAQGLANCGLDKGRSAGVTACWSAASQPQHGPAGPLELTETRQVGLGDTDCISTPCLSLPAWWLTSKRHLTATNASGRRAQHCLAGVSPTGCHGGGLRSQVRPFVSGGPTPTHQTLLRPAGPGAQCSRPQKGDWPAGPTPKGHHSSLPIGPQLLQPTVPCNQVTSQSSRVTRRSTTCGKF